MGTLKETIPSAVERRYAFGITMVGLFGAMIGMGFMHLVRDPWN